MTLRIFKLWAVGALWLTLVAPASAQDFYKGKSIRLIVGASAGGGYDTYSRTIARHMGKHIPGNPGLCRGEYAGSGFSNFCQLHVQDRQARWAHDRPLQRRVVFAAVAGETRHRVRIQ